MDENCFCISCCTGVSIAHNSGAITLIAKDSNFKQIWLFTVHKKSLQNYIWQKQMDALNILESSLKIEYEYVLLWLLGEKWSGFIVMILNDEIYTWEKLSTIHIFLDVTWIWWHKYKEMRNETISVIALAGVYSAFDDVIRSYGSLTPYVLQCCHKKFLAECLRTVLRWWIAHWTKNIH